MKSKVESRKSEGNASRGAVAPKTNILSTFDFRLPTFALLAAVAAGCGGTQTGPAATGSAKAGRAAIERYQCGACHTIPGVAGARGLVGPPLTAYRHRVYIAGKFPQEPDLLARWIRDAPSLAPQTAMPNIGVTEADARDIVAYLYQLR